MVEKLVRPRLPEPLAVVHHAGLKTDLGVEISSVGYARAFKEMVFEESLPLSEKKKISFIWFGTEV